MYLLLCRYCAPGTTCTVDIGMNIATNSVRVHRTKYIVHGVDSVQVEEASIVCVAVYMTDVYGPEYSIVGQSPFPEICSRIISCWLVSHVLARINTHTACIFWEDEASFISGSHYARVCVRDSSGVSVSVDPPHPHVEPRSLNQSGSQLGIGIPCGLFSGTPLVGRRLRKQ